MYCYHINLSAKNKKFARVCKEVMAKKSFRGHPRSNVAITDCQSANKGYKLTQTDRPFWTCTPRKLLLLFRFLGHHVDLFRTEQICSKLKKVQHNLEHWKIERFGEVLNLTSKIEFDRDEPSRRDRNKF